MKKILSTSALFALVAGVLSNASAANLGFTDDASIPSWAEPAIEGLMDLGVMTGNADGSFAPNRQLNRAEVAKIITLATGVPMDTTGGPHFPDVQSGEWYYEYIETMYNNGDINGYPDGMFRPEVGINRAEIAKMVVNAFDCLETDLSGAPHFTDVNSSDWFYSYVETAYNYNLMDGFGDGSFGPELPVTRAETAVIVWNAYLQCSANLPTNEAGTLEVMLSEDTPMGTSIPFNAVSVPYTTVEFTASADADTEIGALTFTRLGLGDSESFDKCWFEVDGFKISSTATVNSDDMVTVRFNPAMVVPAGTTVAGDLVCSMETGSTNLQGAPDNAGQRNRFALVAVEDIDSSAASIVGNFPIEGEEMVIAEYEVSTMEQSCLGTNSTITVGTSFAELYKFKLTNDSNTNKDILLRAMTFKNDGSAELENVIANPALYVNGQQVSVESIVDGDYVSFLLDDGTTGGLVVEDGDSVIFSLRGDLISAEQGDTIKFEIDNAEDIVGVEIGTSFGVRIVDASGDLAEDNATSCATYTLDAGDLTLSRDPSSLGNQEYAPGSDDIVGATCRVVAQQPIATDGIKFCLTTGSVVGDENGNGVANELADFNKSFSNYRLYIDDTLVDTANVLTASAGSTAVTDYCVDFSTTFEIAGTSVMKLAMDIEDAADTGSKVKFQAVATDFDSPEYISTGDQLTSNETVGTCAASFVEVEESKICLSKSDSNSDGDKFVAGADGLNVLSFTGTLNDSGDAVVTSITVMANASGAACSMSNITGAFFVNGTQVGSAQTFNSTGTSCTGTVTFSDLSVVVPSGEQVEFDFIIDTSEVLAMCSNVALGDTVVVDPFSCALTNPVVDGDETVKFGSCTSPLLSGQSIVISADGTNTSTGAEQRKIFVVNNTSTDQTLNSLVAGLPGYAGATFDGIFAQGNTPTALNSAATCVLPAGYVNGPVAPVSGQTTIEGWCGLTKLAPGEAYVVAINTPTPYETVANVAPLITGQLAIYHDDWDSSHSNINPNMHKIGRLGATTTLTAATSACFPVASTANFQSGDMVTIGASGTTPSGTYTGAVSSISSSPKQVCVNFPAPTTFTYATGTPVREVNTGSRIRFFVSQFEAENVENGSTVGTCEGTPELPLGAADTSLDASCGLQTLLGGEYDPVAGTSNYLCGADLIVSCGGRLTVNKNTDIVGDVLTSGDTDKPVLEVRLAATDDQVEVTDLCFINDLDLNDVTSSVTNPTYPFTNQNPTGVAPTSGINGTAVYNALHAAATVCNAANNFGLTEAVGPQTAGAFEGVMQLPSTVLTGYQPEQTCAAAIAAIGAATTTNPISETEVEKAIQLSLYNAAGQKIDGPRNMTNGKVCFQMSNSSRIIVPKDGQTTVTVKATVGNIGSVARTGHALRLRLDENAYDNSGNPTFGVEAISSSTGADLDPFDNNGGNSFNSSNLPTATTGYGLNGDGYGSVYGDVFVVYNTEPTIKHATTQPQIAISSGATSLMPIYYFTVTPDSSDPVSLQRVTFDINLNGMATVCPFAEGDHYDADFTTSVTAPVPAFAPAPASPCVAGVNAPIMTVEDLNASSTGNFATGTVRVLTVDNNATKGDNASPTHATVQVNFKGQYLSSPKTYVLYLANTYDTNPLNTDEQVSVTILKDKVYSSPASLAYQLFRGGDPLRVVDTQANVVWSDDAANLISIETSPQLADFMNGYLINQDVTPQVNDRF